MKLHEAIGACEKGQKITANCLPPGSYLHCDDEGELWVTLDDEDFEDFEAAKFSIDLDGWQTRKKDGKWFNTCPDCVT